MRILFWLLVTGDALVLLLLFVLGLAAAPSSRTSPLAVAWSMLLVPGLILGAAVLLFLRGGTPLARGGAILLAGAPLLIVLGLRGMASLQVSQSTDESGTLVYFRAGPLRDIANAIARNDAATVAALAPKVNLDTKGFANETLLLLALRRLDSAPTELEPLRALLKGGANPNLKTMELPLSVAIQQTGKAGPEPVILLLEAGANPNTKDHFGSPVFFEGVGITVPTSVLTALLDHGADINAQDGSGRTVLFDAVTTLNWPAVLLLLQRGADYNKGRGITDLPFKELVESNARTYGDTTGAKEVLEYLKHH